MIPQFSLKLSAKRTLFYSATCIFEHTTSVLSEKSNTEHVQTLRIITVIFSNLLLDTIPFKHKILKLLELTISLLFVVQAISRHNTACLPAFEIFPLSFYVVTDK